MQRPLWWILATPKRKSLGDRQKEISRMRMLSNGLGGIVRCILVIKIVLRVFGTYRYLRGEE